MEEVIEKEPPQELPLDPPSGVDVQTQGTITEAAVPDNNVTKVIVAIHGVGDQHTYATLQSVVNHFCGFYRKPTAIPLGSFHTGQDTYSIQPPYSAPEFQNLAFAEVYWATIPREVVNEQHTLEEAKKWARTIVERLRLRWKQTGCHGDCTEADFALLKQVLSEMIQTVAVLERLCYLAERAGLFTFDLRKLLDDYLGDVQIVAEFGTKRRKILDTFAELMKKVYKAHPAADIYLVAHSEGTVISFLGLLEAICERQTVGWIDNVRGFMTLGSPIDKHLILWPELFKSDPPTWRPKEKIEWRNYYDRGDPIGFELDGARAWLKRNRWDGVFNFELNHDIGFIRYPFPGKAHVDYWNDDEVFGHFIQTVVNKPPSDSLSRQTTGSNHPTPAVENLDESANAASRFSDPPRDILWKKWLSYVLPYVGVAALLSVAVYILFKAVIGCINAGGEYDKIGVILRDVAGIAALLFGVTVTTRIPRLTRIWYWRLSAWTLYLLSAAGYLWILSSGDEGINKLHQLILATSVLVVVLAYWVSKKWPFWGLKPLILLGTTAAAGIVWYYLHLTLTSVVGPLWPVFLATAGFFYLWWLAALIFDLAFVWHVYIRQSMALERMDDIVGSRARAKTTSLDCATRTGQGQERK